MYEEIKKAQILIGIEKLNNCLLYHFFIGSTSKISDIKTFDIEGENSIFKLIEKLVTEYEKSQ